MVSLHVTWDSPDAVRATIREDSTSLISLRHLYILKTIYPNHNKRSKIASSATVDKFSLPWYWPYQPVGQFCQDYLQQSIQPITAGMPRRSDSLTMRFMFCLVAARRRSFPSDFTAALQKWDKQSFAVSVNMLRNSPTASYASLYARTLKVAVIFNNGRKYQSYCRRPSNAGSFGQCQ